MEDAELTMIGRSRDAIDLVIDPGSLEENVVEGQSFDPDYGVGAIVGTAAVDGRKVTIIANDPETYSEKYPVVFAGVIGLEEAYKMAQAVYRTIEADKALPVAGKRPIVLIVDTPGNAPGKVEEITIEVRKGELMGFAGLLGSGRTETAEMLFGANRATKGEITVNGKKADIKNPHEAIAHRIAFCPEDRKRDGIIGDLSIRENIMLAVQARRGFLHPMSRQEQNELADKYIKALGIATPDAEKKIGELSGGNQQKVILARWMATEPDVLILDEPTRGIDVGAKAEIQRLMLEMCDDGVSVIFISSEMEEVIRCSNRITIMRDGKKAGELVGPFSGDTQHEILKIIAGDKA